MPGVPDRAAELPRPATLCKSSQGLEVWVQNPELQSFIEQPWSKTTLKTIRKTLEATLAIPLTSRGFVQASNRTEAMDPTNYDAVWVRDSVWIYHAFAATGQTEQARLVLRALLDYFGSPAQLARMQNILQHPERAFGPRGAMEVLHIRFDSKSDAFDDVHANGEPQYWNHKQNDALGIFYAAVADALARDSLFLAEISKSGWVFLLRLPTYLEAIEFFSMPDAGAWEEIERINTSSVALCTDALEKWQQLRNRAEVRSCMELAANEGGLTLKSEVLFDDRRLQLLIANGYRRIHTQLPFESPLHSTSTLLFRQADAALLNLLYPCSLKALTPESKLQVLGTVESLAGPRGIRRYFNDAYQSGNYWIKASTDAGLKGSESWTDDCSAPEDFANRTSHMIAGSEAQWFFDSWFSFAAGKLAQELQPGDKQVERLRHQQLHYLHRALGQITGGSESRPDLGGDLKPVGSWACPESYNTLFFKDGIRRFAPSPITPLNWAKASLLLALTGME
jgi:hypothetical protein